MELFIRKIGLVLIPIFILNLQVRNSETKHSKSSQKRMQKADSVVVLKEMKISFDELMNSVKWQRNPFLPMSYLQEKKESNQNGREFLIHPVLKKTFWQETVRVANINEQKFKKGEFFWDMKILYVGETIVVLERDGLPCLLLTIEKENS